MAFTKFQDRSSVYYVQFQVSPMSYFPPLTTLLESHIATKLIIGNSSKYITLNGLVRQKYNVGRCFVAYSTQEWVVCRIFCQKTHVRALICSLLKTLTNPISYKCGSNEPLILVQQTNYGHAQAKQVDTRAFLGVTLDFLNSDSAIRLVPHISYHATACDVDLF